MKKRSDLLVSSHFDISEPAECFYDIPCEPPKGKLVLERLFGVVGVKGKNQIKVDTAAWTVAAELQNLWHSSSLKKVIHKRS